MFHRWYRNALFGNKLKLRDLGKPISLTCIPELPVTMPKRSYLVWPHIGHIAETLFNLIKQSHGPMLKPTLYYKWKDQECACEQLPRCWWWWYPGDHGSNNYCLSVGEAKSSPSGWASTLICFASRAGQSLSLEKGPKTILRHSRKMQIINGPWGH